MFLNWLTQSYLNYKGLFLWLTGPAFISNVCLRPALTVTMFGLAGRFARDEQAAVNLVIGMAVFSMMNIVLGGLTGVYMFERTYGTLHMIFAAPGGRLWTFLGRGLLHYPNGLLNLSISFAWAWLVLSVNLGPANWPAVVLSLMALTLSVLLFSLCLGSLCIMVRNQQFFMAIGQALFIALAGVIIPRAELPWGLRQISSLLPISHGLEGLRQAFDGERLEAVHHALGMELVVGLFYALIGYLMFRLIERHARRSGAYELN